MKSKMNALILLAGGSGFRTQSDTPKQFVEIDGSPVFAYSISPFLTYVDVIVVACKKEFISYAMKVMESLFHGKRCIVVEGGNTGLRSMSNGFEALSKTGLDIDVVFVHDAARPFLGHETIDNCLTCLASNDYAFSSARMSEYVYNCRTDEVEKKDNLYRIMSPHSFKFSFLKSIFDDLKQSDEQTIFNYMVSKQYKMVIAETDETNYKITTSKDLEFAIKILKDEKVY